jgi:hypothetical protein
MEDNALPKTVVIAGMEIVFAFSRRWRELVIRPTAVRKADETTRSGASQNPERGEKVFERSRRLGGKNSTMTIVLPISQIEFTPIFYGGITVRVLVEARGADTGERAGFRGDLQGNKAIMFNVTPSRLFGSFASWKDGPTHLAQFNCFFCFFLKPLNSFQWLMVELKLWAVISGTRSSAANLPLTFLV